MKTSHENIYSHKKSEFDSHFATYVSIEFFFPKHTFIEYIAVLECQIISLESLRSGQVVHEFTRFDSIRFDSIHVFILKPFSTVENYIFRLDLIVRLSCCCRFEFTDWTVYVAIIGLPFYLFGFSVPFLMHYLKCREFETINKQTSNRSYRFDGWTGSKSHKIRIYSASIGCHFHESYNDTISTTNRKWNIERKIVMCRKTSGYESWKFKNVARNVLLLFLLI